MVCYCPEVLFDSMHCQAPVGIDSLDTTECVILGAAMWFCKITDWKHWLLFAVGLIGSCLSLLSSLRSLGNMIGNFRVVGALWMGRIGLIAAMTPKRVVQELFDKMRRRQSEYSYNGLIMINFVSFVHLFSAIFSSLICGLPKTQAVLQ